MANRDTQFAGFAKAVIVRMLEQRNGWIDFNEYDTEDVAEYSAIVARAAYDLVEHVMAFQQTEEYGDIDAIPDLPVLPEEKGK